MSFNNGVHIRSPYLLDAAMNLVGMSVQYNDECQLLPDSHFALKEACSDDSISVHGTAHSNFLLARWLTGLLIGLSLRPTTRMLGWLISPLKRQ